jgi:6,7-dimethyl-8-ribityllumazine synthase
MVTLGLVVAEFNRPVTEEMEAAATAAAEAANAAVGETVHVPGVYDAPLAADRLARREDVDAVAVVGAVVTGDTGHDEVIAEACASGLTEVSLDRDTPVTLGIIGPGMSQDEAAARTHKGGEAVASALDLAHKL